MADVQGWVEVTDDVELAILALWRSYASKVLPHGTPGPITGLLLVFDGPEARQASVIIKVDADGGLSAALETALAAQQACEESIHKMAQEESRRRLAQDGKATVKASPFVQ